MRWIVIADRAEAKIFKQAARGENIQMTTHVDHPEGRMRNQDLKEGRAGRAFESGPHSYQRHAMAVEESPKEHEEHEFARLIVRVLDFGRVQHRYDELVLVAEPGLVGEILTRMDSHLKRMMSTVIRKDLMHLTDDEINKYFKDEPYV